MRGDTLWFNSSSIRVPCQDYLSLYYGEFDALAAIRLRL
jgi:hypothetical protein